MSDTLLLKIDWGGPLKLGAQLSPKFTLVGTNLHQLKNLTCDLDHRLVQDQWNTFPNSTQNGNTWEFKENLTIESKHPLNNDSVFNIHFHALFHKICNNTLVPVEFQTYIDLNVPADKNKTREVTIDAQKGAIITTDEIDWDQFDKVIINAEPDAIVDLSRGIIPKLADKATVPAANSYKMLLNVPPIEFVNIASAQNRGILLLKATSCDGKERFYHLAAGGSAQLGRMRDGSNQFIYRFYRNQKDVVPDPVALYLGRRISRNHLQFGISRDGMEIKNRGNEIELMYNCISRDLNRGGEIRFQWKDLVQDLAIQLVHFSSLRVRKFKTDSVFEKEIQDFLTEKHCFAANNPKDLWNLGAEAGVNSIRIQRLPEVTNDSILLTFLYNGAKKEFSQDTSQEVSRTSPYWSKDMLADEEEYHLLTRMIHLGSDLNTDAIHVSGNHVLPRHATIYYCNQHFGLINHSLTALSCKVYGQSRQLFQSDVLPLQPGMDFVIGDVNFHVYESYANYLEIIQQ